ncbi:hypothetical protein [Streptomyces lavendulocolor]|uniref:hypothetical protein n=1 Tax=Streptomyces lavendulocolor TaxID=67316 RepID=UPI0033D7387C
MIKKAIFAAAAASSLTLLGASNAAAYQGYGGDLNWGGGISDISISGHCNGDNEWLQQTRVKLGDVQIRIVFGICTGLETGPDADTMPQTPDADTMPQTPDADTAPQTPDADTAPQTPDADTAPQTPDADTMPQTPDADTMPLQGGALIG